MILFIHDEHSLEDIRDKFNEFFPYLKLEFYKGPHKWYEGSAENKMLNHGMRIGDIRKKHHQGNMEIHSNFRTGDVEQLFKDKYDLNVQILRLHGTEWVQTAGTDKLTLQEQNEIGQNTSNAMHMTDSRKEKENLL